MIYNNNKVFALNTKHTTYAFRVMDSGHLEHLHYGRKITIDAQSVDALVEKREFASGNL